MADILSGFADILSGGVDILSGRPIFPIFPSKLAMGHLPYVLGTLYNTGEGMVCTLAP